ncbi:MAG: hypothetical protein ACC742_08385 [Thermoanaerobaculales bacterium]
MNIKWRGLLFVLAPPAAAAVFIGVSVFILSRGTARVYGFDVAVDLGALVEGALQVCPLIAALSLMLLAPLRDHLCERLARRQALPARESGMRVLGVLLVSVASATIFLAMTILVVALSASGRPFAFQVFWAPRIWLSLLFDLTLIAVFTHFIHLLTRRWVLSILFFLAYVVTVILVGPQLGISEYIGFGSTPGIILTAYDRTPINFEAAWSWRLYWFLVTMVMLALVFDYGAPAGGLVASIRRPVRKLRLLPAGALAGAVAVAAGLSVWSLSGLRAAAIKPYQVVQANLPPTTPAGSPPRATLESFALDLDYSPDRRLVAVRGSLTLVNDSGEEPLPWVVLEKSLLLNLTEIAGDRPLKIETDRSNRLMVLTLNSPLAPGERLEVTFSGSIGAADRFDSVARTLVLSRAFFLTSGHLLPVPRSPDCFDAPSRGADEGRCNAGESYLMADGARGRLTVTVPRDLEVASVGAVTVADVGSVSSRFVFSIDGTCLTQFFVACAPFAKATVPESADFPAVTVYGPRRDGARLEEIARSALQTLAYYQTVWPAYRYDRLSIVEVPAGLTEAVSYAGAVSINERILRTRAATSEESSGLAKFLLSHELAHQWWGYTLVPARAPGWLFVLESVAQFAAYADLDRRGILAREIAQEREERRYRKALTRPGLEDGRLDQIETEDWLAYHKGPFVLLRLDTEVEGGLMRTIGRLLAAEENISSPVLPGSLVESLIDLLPTNRRESARLLLTTTDDDG